MTQLLHMANEADTLALALEEGEFSYEEREELQRRVDTLYLASLLLPVRDEDERRWKSIVRQALVRSADNMAYRI